jgi:hypothetical protein
MYINRAILKIGKALGERISDIAKSAWIAGHFFFRKIFGAKDKQTKRLKSPR